MIFNSAYKYIYIYIILLVVILLNLPKTSMAHVFSSIRDRLISSTSFLIENFKIVQHSLEKMLADNFVTHQQRLTIELKKVGRCHTTGRYIALIYST